MRVNPKVKATPMKNRGAGPLSVEVVFFPLAFRLDDTSEEDEEDAAQTREQMKDWEELLINMKDNKHAFRLS